MYSINGKNACKTQLFKKKIKIDGSLLAIKMFDVLCEISSLQFNQRIGIGCFCLIDDSQILI